MSASEKLRRLAEQGHVLYLNGIEIEPGPALIAVVEAAEGWLAFDFHAMQHIAGLQHDGHDLRAMHTEDVDTLIAEQAEFRRALAALDEALGER